MGNLNYPNGFEKQGEPMASGEQFVFPDGEYDYSVLGQTELGIPLASRG